MSFAEGTPTVKVQLGGKEYTLGWTWGAKRRVRELMRELGITNPDDANREEYVAMGLWAAMEDEVRATITFKEIEERINPTNEVEISTIVFGMIVGGEPKEKPGKNGEPVAVTEPTTGKSNSKKSGRLESTISA